MNPHHETLFPPHTPPGDEDQIFILTADHLTRTVPIYKTGVTVGSRPDNTVVLDDPAVAPYHVRVEQEEGHYRVIDLNSPSGTFLGDLRLRPGVPVAWEPEAALRIGENWLGLRLALREAEPKPTLSPNTPPGMATSKIDPALIRWSAKKEVGLYVPVEQVSLAPGKETTVALRLYNGSDTSTPIHLQVGGVPAAWIAAFPPVLIIPPQGEQEVNLDIQLPQAPTTRVGRHVINLQIDAQDSPGEQVEASLTLTVLAYVRFRCNLLPPGDGSDKTVQLKIENLGNVPETFFITAHDPSGRLKIELNNAQYRIAEGESGQIEVRVGTPFDLLSVQGRAYPFRLQVRSEEGQVQALDLSVMGQGLLPYWLIPIVFGLLLALCGGITWALVASAQRPTATPTPTLVLVTLTPTPASIDTDADGLTDSDENALGTNPHLADTDGDGLRDGDERLVGSNPLVADSDGDMLRDGDEVLKLHTNPLNADTDGDGLKDDMDPDPLHAPTATPLPPAFTFTPTVLPPTATFLPPTPTLTPLPTTPLPTQPPAPTATAPLLSPTVLPAVNGWIAFESRRDGNLEIYLYRGDSGTELRLTYNETDDRHLVWTAATNHMAFDTDRDGNSEIYVMDIDGTAQTRLTNDPGQDSNPVWAADGLHLAFLSNRDGNSEIYSIDSQGIDLARLTDDAADECCLQWAPAGNLIAFMSNRSGGWGLYRMNADGSDQRALALANVSPPTWSPDGGLLAFVSDRTGSAEIYAIHADGSAEQRLTTNSAQDLSPLWAPNGSSIAFLSNRDGNFEVYVMNADGSNQRRLTTSPGNECCLVWSPDGSQLAFGSDSNANSELSVVQLTTLGILRLTHNSAYDAPLAWHP